MSVTVKESTMVHPSEATPTRALWLSSLDMIIRQPYSHTPLFYVYRPNHNQNRSNFFDTKILKQALSRSLVPFYPLAGRLKKNEETNRFEVECNGEGALFEEVETTHTLADFGDFKPNTKLRNMVIPKCDYSGGLSSFPIFMVRVTRFKCGGVCLGFAVHHHVGDGISYVYFVNSWARLARGLDLLVLPFHERFVFLGPREPPQVKFRHLEYEPALPALPPKSLTGESLASTMECLFKLYKHQIHALKLEATSHGGSSFTLSTYEVLAGHVWRSACKARGLTGDQCVKLYIPTDGRSRFNNPALPQGYFGNALFYMACIAKAKDVTCKPVWYAANKVHEALKRSENIDYLKSSIDYLESQPDLTSFVRGAYTVTCPNLYHWICIGIRC